MLFKIKKWQTIVLIIAIIGTAMSMGIIASPILNKSDVSTQNYKTSEQDNDKENIAIVNMDTGVQTEEGSQNYSTVLIETFGNEYNLVPSGSAEAGLKDGTYDALVVFPSEFSQKAASVNSNIPDNIELSYKVSDEISEDKYVNTCAKINKLQSKVNETLSYLYVYSIYEELHLAQNQGHKILKNSKKDMKALDTVKAYNFINNLDMGDIPDISLDLSKINFKKFVATISDYGKNMNSLYTDDYNRAEAKYLKVNSDMEKKARSIQSKVSGYEAIVSNKYNLATNWFMGRTESSLGVDGEFAVYNKNVNAMNEKITTYNDYLESYKEQLEKLLYVDSQLGKGALVDHAENLPGLIESYEKELMYLDRAFDMIEFITGDSCEIIIGGELSRKISLADLYYENLAGTEDIGDIKVVVNKSATNHAKAFRTKLAAGTTTWEDYISSISAINIDLVTNYSTEKPLDLANLDAKLPSAVEVSSTGLTTSINDYQAIHDSYRPKGFVTDKMKRDAAALVTKYATDIGKMKTSLDSSQTGGQTQMTKAFNKYSTQVFDLRQDLTEQYDKEHKSVQDLVSALVTTKNATFKENKDVMSTFINKMPNSKANASVNNRLVEFISQPVALAESGISDAEKDDFKGMIPYICLILSVLVLIVVGIISYRGMKKDDR